MKTKKSIFKLSILATFILFGPVFTNAQEQTATMEKSYEIDSGTTLEFHCYNSDLNIKTWNNQRVKLTGNLSVRGGDKQDREKVIKAFRNPEKDQSATRLTIDTKFHKTFAKSLFGSWMKLKNNERASVKDYTTDYTLFIPKDQDIELVSKYNEIQLDDLTGRVKMEIYNGKLKGGNFGKDYTINMKYSEAEMKNGNNGKIVLYDSEVEFEEVGDLELSAKYSQIEIGKATDIKLDSYDDEISINELNTIKGEAKYSGIEIFSNTSNCELTLYDCEFEARDIKVFELDTKYSDIEAGIIGYLDCGKLHDNEITAKGAVKIKCNESKYDNIRLGSIQESIHLPRIYDTDITVDKVSEKFQNFSGDLKYCSIKLPLPASLNYKLKFDSKYGSISFPQENFKGNIQSIKKNDQWEFEGYTKDNPECTIKFSSYDSDIEFE